MLFRSSGSLGLGSGGFLSLDIEESLLVSVGLGELEGDLVGGEFVVDVGKGVNFVSHGLSVEGVEHNSLVHLTVSGDSLSSSDNVGGGSDIVEDGGVDGLEGSRSGSHLRRVVDGSLGDDGAVSNNDARPLELSLEVVDDGGGDLLVGTERSEGDSDEEVVGDGFVSLSVLNGLDGVDEHTGELNTLGLEGGEGFGEGFVEFGELLSFSLDDLR